MITLLRSSQIKDRIFGLSILKEYIRLGGLIFSKTSDGEIYESMDRMKQFIENYDIYKNCG